MKETTKRSIFRCIHVIFGIPIIEYVYGPFEEIPNYAPAVRFFSLPVILLSGCGRATSCDASFQKARVDRHYTAPKKVSL
jgi:hypothetical protein